MPQLHGLPIFCLFKAMKGLHNHASSQRTSSLKNAVIQQQTDGTFWLLSNPWSHWRWTSLLKQTFFHPSINRILQVILKDLFNYLEYFIWFKLDFNLILMSAGQNDSWTLGILDSWTLRSFNPVQLSCHAWFSSMGYNVYRRTVTLKILHNAVRHNTESHDRNRCCLILHLSP